MVSKSLRQIFGIVLLFALVVALALCYQPAHAAGIVGTGTPQSCTESALITVMADGGLVTFSCGPNPATIVFTAAKTISQSTSIDGGNLITLSGSSTVQLFVVNAGATLTLSNITLADGYTPGIGAAIANSGTVVIRHSLLYSNTAGTLGGGIYNSGVLTLSNVNLTGNSAHHGGGIYNDGDGTLTLIGSTLSRNLGPLFSSGGGIYINAGTAMLNSVTLSGNTASWGGGIYINAGTAMLNSVTLSGNTAGGGQGGGIFNQGGTLTLIGSTLSANTAGYSGGGLYNGGTLTLIGSTLSDNWGGLRGGGIDNPASSLSTIILIDSTLSGNSTTGSGGAMFNYGGTLTLTNSTLSGNLAGSGGGIFHVGPRLTLNSVKLSGNKASFDGGGIFAQGGPLTLNSVTLRSNSATRYGGAIYSDYYDTFLELNDSTLSGNSAGTGGGLYNDGKAALNNSTLSANTAITGGGIYNGIVYLNLGGALTLTNATLSGNTATLGGGVYNSGLAVLLNATLNGNSAVTGGALETATSFTTSLTNTILAYSPTGGNCNGAIVSSKYNISSDGTCALGGTGDQNNLDPQLTALGNYGGPTLVHMLKLGSPAIDGVVGTPSLATDQRGLPRSTDGNYDIGAVERQFGDSDLAPRLYLPAILR